MASFKGRELYLPSPRRFGKHLHVKAMAKRCGRRVKSSEKSGASIFKIS
jgi:hypothetical protein